MYQTKSPFDLKRCSPRNLRHTRFDAIWWTISDPEVENSGNPECRFTNREGDGSESKLNMLNPPLSLLSADLLNYIVDHVANLPSSNLHLDLYNLSITDRAFTRFCQAYIFKDLYLDYTCETDNSHSISKKLAKIRNILNDEPSFANRVRTVHLTVTEAQNRWLFNDHNFITVFQLLAKSVMPPHRLRLIGDWESFIIEDPILVVGWLMQSFFSQTLTVLDLTYCENVPLTLFLVCPNLKEVCLDGVGVFEFRRRWISRRAVFRPRVTSTRTSVLPRFGEPRQADDHSAAQILYGSSCLVRAACSEDMSAGEGRNGMFTTYPRRRLQHNGRIISLW